MGMVKLNTVNWIASAWVTKYTRLDQWAFDPNLLIRITIYWPVYLKFPHIIRSFGLSLAADECRK